ncbi:hypothetical protein FJT64_010079 [Amphibalanus amphitrite]|uniref:Uncharacterized protein n=1 Tax=Amphibalanus amphitrite TaxID=1232801 RepID=A0A6A4VRK8_AMPAM|nr:hypothetical protein FJT64_010079 [Amphibalanus amphitrite]
MSESAQYELVEGAVFQMSDGTSVTVRDGQLELSDGSRLPTPAAGEAITVERTVTRPDGGTTRIKHTIRLSEPEPQPIVETPARPFAGAGPGPDEQDTPNGQPEGETVPAPETAAVVETAPAAQSETSETDGAPAAPQQTSAEPTPAQEAEKAPAPVTPVENTLMGVNCGRRSLREMLWGSIPESGFGEDEDEPKAPPKGLLNKSYSIKEEDESEHEDDEVAHEEPLESSENADASFEFVEDKAKDSEAEKQPESSKESPKDDGTANEKPKNENVSEKEEDKKEPETSQDSTAGGTPEKIQSDQVQESAAGKSDEPSSADVSEAKEPESESDPPTAEKLAEQAAALMATTVSLDEAPAPAEPHHEKRHLTRQHELPSSGNPATEDGDEVVVRVGVPVVDAAPAGDCTGKSNSPAGDAGEKSAAPAGDSSEKSAAPAGDSSEKSAAPAAAPRPDEVTSDLHLKLTPILRSLETDEPKGAGPDGDGERPAKPAPGEDRKGTVPPNTPAVAEEREGLPGADEAEIGQEPVSVPKVVSYYESISPRASPAPTRPRDAATSTVPKVIKFAEPSEPEKVYLDGQEPEDAEDSATPRSGNTEETASPRSENTEETVSPRSEAREETATPRSSEEPLARVELAPEPAAQQPTQVLVAVRGTPDDLDPLSALAAERSAPPEEPATPSTTPEKETEPEPAPEGGQTGGEQPKPEPPVYRPELFEPEPKRPLIITSERVDEDAPPYEPGVHDARTLPLGRKTAVVTEQPPPFGEDDRSDPRDPFLPDQPRPGASIKDDGWLSTCFDLCCCCWAP